MPSQQASSYQKRETSRPFTNGTAAASYNISVRDWGKILIIPVIAAGIDLTLALPIPNTASGASFSIHFEGTSASDGNLICTLGGGSSLGVGTIRENYPNTVIDAAVTDDFTLTGAQLGSFIEFFCNGSNWFVKGSVEYITTYNDTVSVDISSTNFTVLESNTGKTHFITAGHASNTINLPTVGDVEGAVFKFVFAAAETATFNIDTANGFIRENYVNDKTIDTVITADFEITTPAIGSWVELVSDGTTWLVSGNVRHTSIYDNSVTVTYPSNEYTLPTSGTGAGKVHLFPNPTVTNAYINLGPPSSFTGGTFEFVLTEDLTTFTVTFLCYGSVNSGFNGVIMDGTAGTPYIFDTDTNIEIKTDNKRGTWIRFFSDGTMWAVNGMATGAVYAQQYA